MKLDLKRLRLWCLGQHPFGRVWQRNSSGEEDVWVKLPPYKRNIKGMRMNQLCVRGINDPLFNSAMWQIEGLRALSGRQPVKNYSEFKTGNHFILFLEECRKSHILKKRKPWRVVIVYPPKGHGVLKKLKNVILKL